MFGRLFNSCAIPTVRFDRTDQLGPIGLVTSLFRYLFFQRAIKDNKNAILLFCQPKKKENQKGLKEEEEKKRESSAVGIGPPDEIHDGGQPLSFILRKKNGTKKSEKLIRCEKVVVDYPQKKKGN